MRKIIFIVFLILSLSTVSQIKVTGYFDAEIGLSYSFTKRLQTELRVNDNLNQEFNTELSILYKIISKENYNMNFGLGISTFPFHSSYISFVESLFIPAQLEITPFSSAKNFAFVLESAYHFSDITDNSGIRNSIGIRYIFK
jgi:hypothetical protein